MKFFAQLKDKKTRKEILKFMAVGVSTTVIDFFVMALIIFCSKPEYFDYNLFAAFGNVGHNDPAAPTTATIVMATGVGFLVAFLANYLLSVFFVYRYGNVGKNKKGFLKFLLFALIGLIVQTVGEFIGFDLLKINVWIIKIILSVIMFVFNYFTRKYFIFNIDLIIDEEKTIRL